jgi:hypothetical protein
MTDTKFLNLFYIALKHFKNEADTTAFVKEIEFGVKNKFDAKYDTSSTKEDPARLEVKIAQSKSYVVKWLFRIFSFFRISDTWYIHKNVIPKSLFYTKLLSNHLFNCIFKSKPNRNFNSFYFSIF